MELFEIYRSDIEIYYRELLNDNISKEEIRDMLIDYIYDLEIVYYSDAHEFIDEHDKSMERTLQLYNDYALSSTKVRHNVCLLASLLLHDMLMTYIDNDLLDDNNDEV